MSSGLNENQMRNDTIYDVENKNKKEYMRREQEGENRRFDNIATSHREQICFLQKTVDDIDLRLKKLENFKYILIGIGIAIGFLAQPLYDLFQKSFSD